MESKKRGIRIACGFSAVVLLFCGCNKNEASKPNLEKAINSYYSAHPECLWPASVKFPTQEASSDIDKTRGYDALTDQGLLTRIESTKKVFIFGSKQESNYDLSDKGRAAWTQDPQHPGFGNFCFGHRTVTSIDGTNPYTANGSSTTSASVAYHYSIPDAAGWARNEKMESAFPSLQTVLVAPQADKANLVLTQSGWQLSKD